jgi:outer membrane protein TolC
MSDARSRSVLALLAALALPSAAPAETPLTLRQAVERAVERAPELAVARAAAEEGEAASRLAADAFHTEAYLTANPGYGRGLPSELPAIASVGARKALYDPQRLLAGISAQVGETGARSNLLRVRREAARTAAQLYARCWADERLLAGAGRRQEAFARLSATAEARHREGRLTDLELEQARLREARAHLRRAELEAARDLDRAELRRLTGWPEDAPLDLAADPLASLPEPAGDDLAAARASDPDLREEDATLELLGEAAEVRHRLFSPTVEAATQYSRLTTYTERYYRRFKADDWSAALSIAIPLWSGGRAADANAQADAHRSRVEGERRAREAELASQVRRAATEEARAQAAADLGKQSLAVANAALKVAEALNAEGRIDPQDVAARQADLADAEEESLNAAAGLAEARAARLALRGELPGAGAPPAP